MIKTIGRCKDCKKIIVVSYYKNRCRECGIKLIKKEETSVLKYIQKDTDTDTDTQKSQAEVSKKAKNR
ncbi:hypothetical protein HYX00_01480 [Candidatus Woesearchaeota archaeon]|nr:hypothetical protein [Candidatus Woesearchaeota archaeon]